MNVCSDIKAAGIGLLYEKISTKISECQGLIYTQGVWMTVGSDMAVKTAVAFHKLRPVYVIPD